MKICLIGVFRGRLEEGYRIISHNTSRQVKRCHEVLEVDGNDVLHLRTIRTIHSFAPDLIHHVTVTNVRGYMVLYLLRLLSRRPPTVVSTLHSRICTMFERWYNRCALRLFKPALVLTHSPTLYSRWGDLGVEVCIVPNGVDTERYHPVSAERKTELRMKYGIPESSFVILHVGHIEKRRGLDVLIDVITGYKDVTVIIVASSFFKKDIDLYNRIKDAGALILEDLPSDLSEIYALSDCYLFSAIKHASIFMPLSVMEAMATNIPVISTPYEGLRTFFDEGNGIYYYSTQDELFSHTVTF